jgi:hypothetical protein
METLMAVYGQARQGFHQGGELARQSSNSGAPGSYEAAASGRM